MAALDLATGRILWKTYLTPSADFPGNAVWGSSPAIDTKRRSVYIGTGNNYNVPDSVLACITAAGGDPAAERACLPANNYFDSILSLDIRTGAIKWAGGRSFRTLKLDLTAGGAHHDLSACSDGRPGRPCRPTARRMSVSHGQAQRRYRGEWTRSPIGI